MIHQLTPQVWFGNWEAPFECLGQVCGIINVAHHFSPKRGRAVYWQRLAELRHDVPYFRLSRKDRENVDEPYLMLLADAAGMAYRTKPLPILTHCQLGGHRGPSSALFLAWLQTDRSPQAFDALHARVLELVPGLARGRNYYQSLVAWIRGNTARAMALA